MKIVLPLLTFCVLATCGCVSKSRNQLDVREAFLAGQQQAMAVQRPGSSTAVTVRGDVKNSVVPWKEEMTLAQAIAAAEYEGLTDPKRIILRRNGETLEINPRELLQGKDMPVQAGDVVDILR